MPIAHAFLIRAKRPVGLPLRITASPVGPARDALPTLDFLFWTQTRAEGGRIGGETTMRHAFTWVVELVKLFSGQRIHPVSTECPICRQMVRLHVNKGGRRHMYAHARSLYEGSRFYAHYVAKMKCPGSSAPAVFDPRPNERQRFKLPDALR
jgi:hypothetical protein